MFTRLRPFEPIYERDTSCSGSVESRRLGTSETAVVWNLGALPSCAQTSAATPPSPPSFLLQTSKKVWYPSKANSTSSSRRDARRSLDVVQDPQEILPILGVCVQIEGRAITGGQAPVVAKLRYRVLGQAKAHPDPMRQLRGREAIVPAR